MGRIVSSDLPLIEDVSRHLLQTRGKLFRPTLTLLASSIADRPQERAITMAAAIELMHLATLVHDDSVDHSVLRRGLPTVNSLFSHQVSVIMGDFLYSRALHALVQEGDIDVLRILTRVSNDLTVGEMRQLAAVDRLSFPESEYFELIRAKTATLLSAACEVGALCGAPAHRDALALYGDRLGMVFQIADDILDCTGDAEDTGKVPGTDLREGTPTLPLLLAAREDEVVRRALMGGPLDGALVRVAQTGALLQSRELAVRYAERARVSLDGGVYRGELEALTYAVVDRKR
jgi:octaprenyl-diphosphate synthase